MVSEDVQIPRPLASTAGGYEDPLLRLQQETQLGDGVMRLRATTHPEEIRVTGIPVMCPNCGARRDWMVICDRSTIRIRCRCAHEWVEPELNRADYESMIDAGGRDHPSLEAAAQSMGYDGALAGTYFSTPRPE
ncbi:MULTISPECIES: hypothetical protein [unclassified Streptomyces]|uniref:hypothetical protein n=1 Tax=unclassified Streptomyces TaxID=2593676 RepID=UPI002E18DAC7|nr:MULTISPECIES: hypothetical protein [unclassified Streptomyces]